MSLGTGMDLSYGNGRLATPHESTASQLLARALHPAEPRAEDVRREHFLAALSAWENLLGREHVRYDAETLDRYSKNTLPWSTRPSAVVRPWTLLPHRTDFGSPPVMSNMRVALASRALSFFGCWTIAAQAMCCWSNRSTVFLG